MDKLAAFAKFAGSKPADERYDFMNSCGGCAIGQWMRSTSSWSLKCSGITLGSTKLS